MENEAKFPGAGGTSGGIGEFFLGLIMAVAGGYILTNRVVVASSFWSCGAIICLVYRCCLLLSVWDYYFSTENQLPVGYFYSSVS
jgi:hypothetical protein